MVNVNHSDNNTDASVGLTIATFGDTHVIGYIIGQRIVDNQSASPDVTITSTKAVTEMVEQQLDSLCHWWCSLVDSKFDNPHATAMRTSIHTCDKAIIRKRLLGSNTSLQVCGR